MVLTTETLVVEKKEEEPDERTATGTVATVTRTKDDPTQGPVRPDPARHPRSSGCRGRSASRGRAQSATMPSRRRSRAERADGLDLDVGLGVAAVARRLGVAPATLRTWDRRYGVGPTRARGGHPPPLHVGRPGPADPDAAADAGGRLRGRRGAGSARTAERRRCPRARCRPRSPRRAGRARRRGAPRAQRRRPGGRAARRRPGGPRAGPGGDGPGRAGLHGAC